jgi:hypothetical protein
VVLTTDRAVLIRYERDGQPRHGSGLRVAGRFVLTADHCANGTGHVVVTSGREYDAQVFARGSAAVDVAVLEAPLLPVVEPVGCAVLDRSVPREVPGCWALGFPVWKDLGRVLAQVPGNVPTAEGVDPGAGPGVVPPMSLKITNPDIRGHQVPGGELDQPGSPWAGMSGAVVVTGEDLVVGVIRGHSLAEGAGSLTATRLEAVTALPADVASRFLDALQVPDPREWPRVPPPGGPGARGAVAAGQVVVGDILRQPEFSAEVRDRYGEALIAAGLDVPDRWGRAELGRLRRVYQEQATGATSTAELLEALCGALDAMTVLDQIGGRDIGIRKLQDLYQRHVGRWPEAGSREGMLIMAASAGVAEQRRSQSEAGYRAEPLIALARFMLGVAAHWKAPRRVTLDDSDLRGLADWLTGPLGQQRDDAVAYLADKVGSRTWVLIELRAEDLAVRAWPDRIVVELVRENGPPGRTRNIPCLAETEEGLRQALRNACSNLPEGEVFVDLFMPRQLLDAGVEHWKVVKVGREFERMSRYLAPRLRWSMHRSDSLLRDLLGRRTGKLAWLADPVMIPESAAADPAQFEGWIDSWDSDGTTHPPYFTGSPPAVGGCDALGALLKDGYGFIVWFGPDAKEDVKQEAVRIAAGLSALERRHDLPQVLAARLKGHRPAIIWSDPEGRAGFQLPAPRRGGTLRRGAR